MSHALSAVHSVTLPAESAVNGLYHAPDLVDAFAVRLPDNASHDPELLARFVFAHQAAWIGKLMGLRDAIVSLFGLKTARELRTQSSPGSRDHVDIFRIYKKSAHEIVLGENDSHLDFRLSLLQQTRDVSGTPSRYLVLSTVVHCHNGLGRFYILAIRPFHRMVVRSSLQSAARVGWPAA